MPDATRPQVVGSPSAMLGWPALREGEADVELVAAELLSPEDTRAIEVTVEDLRGLVWIRVMEGTHLLRARYRLQELQIDRILRCLAQAGVEARPR